MASHDPTSCPRADRNRSSEPTGERTAECEPGPGSEIPEADDRPPTRRESSRPQAQPSDQSDEEPGRILGRPATMAILSHMSVLFGVPVFLVPLVRRQHPLSLHHAKAAAVIWFAFYLALALSFFVSGLFTPLMVLLYLPALVGISRAVQNRPAGRWGAGDLAEWLFEYPTARDDSDISR